MQMESLQQALAHHQAGRFDAAVRLYRDMLRRSPGRYDVRINLGAALSSTGALGEAIVEFRQALAARPDSAEACNNLGSALQRTGRREEAIEYLRRAVALRPGYADARNNLGLALMEAERLDEAAQEFRRALSIAPDHADATFNLGNILLFGDQPEAAITCYNRVLALRPDYTRARYNLGTALCRLNRVAEGFEAWTFCADAIHGATRGQAPARDAGVAEHARQQRAWLIENPGAAGAMRIGGGVRVAGPALNAFDGAAISREWDKARPKFALIDNALNPEALAGLQAFCVQSDIWHTAHPDGYVIAGPEDGMACPLMAQVVSELRAALPDILGTMPLHYIAGFKYAAGRGCEVHADSAAVNVNLWITPDEANLEPGRGGLQVWDLVAPGPDTQLFNGDTPRTRALLKDSAIKPTIVPYRCNRMVVFDSDLFHETDRFEFRDSYSDRRINITMLFGKR